MKQYECFELSFTGEAPKGSQVVVNLTATFLLGEKKTEVKGFYAGNGTYKVRFYPQSAGSCRYEIHGIAEASGEVQCEAATGHGMVRAEGTHFVYEDGSRYIPFGTTIYALVHQERALVDQTMRSLGASPFNKLRTCVFPKHYSYNNNEPEFFPFEKTDGKWDFDKPCFAFWDMLEARINELQAMGLETDLILFHPYDRWGFSSMSEEDCFKYLEYLTRRLSAIPNVWWSLANEFDLMPGFGMELWRRIAAFISREDAYGHLLSNHNCFRMWDFTNENTTHCCIQSSYIDEAPYWARKTGKPVIYDEMCYEGNIEYGWGNISAFEMVNRFWMVCSLGGFGTHGETYVNPEEVLWWSKGGVLRGESPERIAFLKEIMYSLPGPLEYHRTGIILERDSYQQLHEGKPLEGSSDDNMYHYMLNMDKADLAKFAVAFRQYMGCCKELAYLHYYARNCTSVAAFDLPEDSTYTVEIIDVWEMTRTVVSTDACGQLKIALPGKEGMAVLAIRN